jgi:hypothetical protein
MRSPTNRPIRPKASETAYSGRGETVRNVRCVFRHRTSDTLGRHSEEDLKETCPPDAASGFRKIKIFGGQELVASAWQIAAPRFAGPMKWRDEPRSLGL